MTKNQTTNAADCICECHRHGGACNINGGCSHTTSPPHVIGAFPVWGFGEMRHCLWHGDRVVFDSCRDMGLTSRDAREIEERLNAESSEDATKRADQAEAKLISLRELVVKYDPALAAVIGLS